jgi:hypothetical protein
MEIKNFSARAIVVGVMLVFIWAGMTGKLSTDIIKDAFLFVAGAVFGRGRASPPEKTV